MRRHGRDKRLKKVEVDSKSQVCCWKPQVFACDFKSAATLSRRRCSAVDSSHPYRPRLLIGPAHFRDLSSFIGPAHFPLFESFTWPGPFLRFESARLLRLSSSTGGRPPPPARLPPSPSSHPLPCHLLILVFSSPSRLLLLLLLSSQRRPQGQGPAAPQQVSSNTQITTQFNTTQTASISNTPAASSRSRPRRTPTGEGWEYEGEQTGEADAALAGAVNFRLRCEQTLRGLYSFLCSCPGPHTDSRRRLLVR